MTTGTDARDAGLKQVTENNQKWSEEVLDYIEGHIPVGWCGTGEDIRHLTAEAGLSQPKHHNAWGAVIMVAIRHRGLLTKTGRLLPMRDRTSHARATWEYIRT